MLAPTLTSGDIVVLDNLDSHKIVAPDSPDLNSIG
jgi:hypothetical protein